ncbi:HlyD family efflux transporter periplasmic adaptor subunit [Aerosakkonemataceae cyanobacterium BLCC-F154]|uniref:HlyD family efflux transporter periplasmic adaptor subunit n=1 Tax=Floridaenema fluviatile BLCC-F154 TaxID=3153640 RepID=A0ABV4YBN3_9CYAN
MSPTNSHNQPQQIKLKVVPPTTEIKPPISQKEETTNTPATTNLEKTSPNQKARNFNYGRLLIIGGLIVAGTWVSQIPIPNSVRTEAKLEPLPDSHRFIYMQFPGSVDKFWVNPGDRVKVGQPVASIIMLDLDAEIIQKQARLQEQESALAAANAKIPVMEAKLAEAMNLESSASRLVSETREEIQNLSLGNPPPEIQKLQAEIAALNSKIPGIQSEIVGLEKNLQGVEALIQNYEKPELKVLMRRLELQDKIKELEGRKATFQADISRNHQLITEVKHQVSAKHEEIKSWQKSLQQKLDIRQDELISKTAISQTAKQEFVAVKDEVKERQPMIETLRKELQQLRERQQNNQVLTAPISGVIVSQNLHEKVGKKLAENQEVLEVANLSKLVALIEVSQADSDLVKEITETQEAKVILQPLEPGLPGLVTKIEKIEPVLQSDVSGQKQLLRVRAIVDNQQQLFQPNAKVYAQIEVKSIPLYQRVQRELMKLFQVRKYV